jgi:hypothetical protein
MDRETRNAIRKKNRGLVWYGLQKFSTPISRYSTIIAERTAVMTEGGGLHGGCKYFRSFDSKKYIRLQVIAATSAYVEIDARLVTIDDALRHAQGIGFNALFKKNPDALIKIVSSVEDIDNYLDDIWGRWGWQPDKNTGSKWRRLPNGYVRISDGKTFSKYSVRSDPGGWNFIESGGEIITFHDNDVLQY